MRAGVSTVQQTLTTEAANVLKLAVAEAQRRGHAQVTPLHVATTLLSGTTSILRQACIQSHLHLPQPPHCRNLELCFKVALDRLQTSTTATGSVTVSNSSAGGNSTAATNLGLQVHHHAHHHHPHLQHQQVQQPALSNALVAALKRAQAHQRRGYPEQQQVPLLAVKVEMEQLIISILDDPSVSRVMREASFSSTQVKNSLEEALAAAAAAAGSSACSTPGSSSTCSAQARRILPAAGATASLVVNPSGSNVDRLRLKLGSLESYSAGGTGASPINFQHSRSSSANLIIPGLLVNQGGGSGGGGGVRANVDQLSNVLLSMAIPPPISSSGAGLGGRSSVDVGRVFEVLLKSKKRNPLLFGEQSPHGVAEEVMSRLEKGECEPSLRSLRIVSPQFASIALGLHGKEEVEHKLGELVRAVETNLVCSPGVIVYLGDLQWLVERPPNPSSSGSVYCPVQHAVSEIEKLLLGQGSRVWLMGVASSQTYMRCQARHPCLDNVWGLQPLPISTGFNMSLRNPNTSNPPNRFGSSSASVMDSPTVRVPAAGRWPGLPFKLQSEDETGHQPHHLENCCAECVSKYEQEVHELEKKNLSTSDESSSTTGGNTLPFWLKPSKESSDQVNGRSQKVKELQKKWSQTCRSVHGASRNTTTTTTTTTTITTNNNSNPSLRGENGGKVGTGVGGMPMSIPWLSLQPTGAKGTAPVHGKDVGSVCNGPEEDGLLLSTDIGLSLKPTSATGGGGARSTELAVHQQQHKQESEVTVHTDLVLGRSVNNNATVTTKVDKASSNCSSVSNGKLSPNLEVKNRLQSLVTPVLGFPPVASSPPLERRYVHEPPQLPASTPLITANNGVTNLFKAPPAKELDFKALCKALADNVPWQREAVDRIASTVLYCRSGAEKRRGTNAKTDTWLLLLGSDVMAKRKVARILAEQVFGSEKMFFRLSLRSQGEKVGRGQERDGETNGTLHGRGRTPLDRLAEAVRSKPFSVVLLEDVEHADPRLKSALMKAAERGRLADSSGREVSVANLIFVMTSSIGEELLPQEKSSFNALELNEKTVSDAEIVGMKLLVEEAGAPEAVVFTSGRVSLVNNPSEAGSLALKRKGCELEGVPKRSKAEPRGVELDLNLPSDEAKDGDDILVEEVPIGDEETSPKDDQMKLVLEKASEQLSKSFCSKMSGTVVFKPFSFTKLAELVVAEMNNAVSATSSRPLEVDSTLFKHLVAVVWEGQGRHDEFQKWVTQVLEASISSLADKTELPDKQHRVIKLVADTSESTDLAVLHLPKRIKIGDGGT